MAYTTPRKRDSVIIYANIPNLTKKILHKSLGVRGYGSCCIKLLNNPANGCPTHFKRFENCLVTLELIFFFG